MIHDSITIEKKIQWSLLRPFFQELDQRYLDKEVRVIIFIDADDEDVEMMQNRGKLKQQFNDSLLSWVSDFSI